MREFFIELTSIGIGYFIGAFLGSLFANAIITIRNRRREKEEEG